MSRRRFFSFITALAAALAACLCLAVFTGCQAPGGSGSRSEEFFLENGDGTYTHGEIVMPAEDNFEPVPLVCMSHGIYGSMNSGGARELAQRLAAEGIGSVRVDFNRCTSDDPAKALAEDKSGRTNEYTLSEMLESNLLAINYALDNYPVDPDRLGVYGRSFGGRVAMIMGNESSGGFDYKAMALIAPAGNEYALIHYMGGDKVWDSIRAKAERDGSYTRRGLILTSSWFEDYYRYDPSLTGGDFGDKPVMVYYNTLDKVVEPKTSLACARAYSNVTIYKCTTTDGHGYEMSFKKSELKEEIMGRLVDFFKQNL